MRRAAIPAALWFALALAACDYAARTSEAALLAPSPVRLGEIATATATPLPSSTPLPTATPSPIATPSPTATPLPIATPSPIATPLPTATPSPPPTPVPPSPTPARASEAAGSRPLIVLDGGETTPTVSVGGAAFDVEIAFTPEDRARGLSGRDSLPDGSGMLFVFENGQASSFWMREMRFDLDFVWIGDGCEVVDIHARVPAPAAGASVGDLPIYSSQPPARYNLEINAGEAAKRGIEIGARARFIGFSGEGATCE